MSLLNGSSGAVIGPSVKFVGVPLVGKKRSKIVPHGLWMNSSRVGGPLAAAASSWRSKSDAIPAPMPPPRNARRLKRPGLSLCMAFFVVLLESAVAKRERG